LKVSRDRLYFNTSGYVLLTVLAGACLLPFLLIVAGSVSDETAIYTDGYRLIPRQFSLKSYGIIFRAPASILRAYAVTLMLTAAGTALGLFLTAMTAFALQTGDCKYRNVLAFYMYFTMLFNGGLTPFYILMVRGLHLKNTYWAMLLPSLLSVWFILLTRNYMKSIPREVYESAKIDGAGYFAMFLRITMPLSVPVLATIGLFIALGYWNDWYYPMLFVEDSRLYPMQFFLYRLLNAARFSEAVMKGANVATANMPKEGMKMAMAVVATGPIIFLYPFIQRFFIRGLMIGAVKG